MSGTKIITLTGRRQGENKGKAQGETRTVTGVVTARTEFTDAGVTVFNVRHGQEDTLFWVPTEGAISDPGLHAPLAGDTVRVRFNNRAARSMDAGGEIALGVTDIRNVSEDAEEAAFRWFREHPDGPPWLKR